MKFVRVLISATSNKEAKTLVTQLAQKNLIAGALVTHGQVMYWWKDRLVERKYWNVSAFTRATLKKKVIAAVRPLNKDEVPIISFYEILDANPDFLAWVAQNTFQK
jgi:uncharacterized protein involved in tolerance to divalent cations